MTPVLAILTVGAAGAFIRAQTTAPCQGIDDSYYGEHPMVEILCTSTTCRKSLVQVEDMGKVFEDNDGQEDGSVPYTSDAFSAKIWQGRGATKKRLANFVHLSVLDAKVWPQKRGAHIQRYPRLVFGRGAELELELGEIIADREGSVPRGFSPLDSGAWQYTPVVVENSMQEERLDKCLAWASIPDPRRSELVLTIPPDAAVGKYELLLVDRSGGVKYQASFVVLFNAACSKCDEYIRRRQDREAYVDATTGIIAQGAGADIEHYSSDTYQYEPKRASNMLAALYLLKDLSAHQRRSPVEVARVLPRMINEEVCEGRWEEPYNPGGKWPRQVRDPGDWKRISLIYEMFLAQLARKSKNVFEFEAGSGQQRWCQCFIFAALLNTAGRSLGLGTRAVTAFDAAHDDSGDRAISHFYLENAAGNLFPLSDEVCPSWCEEEELHSSPEYERCEEVLEQGHGFGKSEHCLHLAPCIGCRSGSYVGEMIWNFHVWNEIYMRRGTTTDEHAKSAADTGYKSKYSGWQVLDATYGIGPASVKGVKRGDDTCWDTDFVTGEVSADIKVYIIQGVDDVEDLEEATRPRQDKHGQWHPGTAHYQLTEGEPLFQNTRFASHPFFAGEHAEAAGRVLVTQDPATKAGWANAGEGTLLDVTKSYKKPNQWGVSALVGRNGHRSEGSCTADEGDSLVEVTPFAPETRRSLGLRGDVRPGDVEMEVRVLCQPDPSQPDRWDAGYVAVDRQAGIAVKLRNAGSEPRTVRVVAQAMPFRYTGKPFTFVRTRRTRFPARIVVEGDNTRAEHEVVIPPNQEGTWKLVVEDGFSSGSLTNSDVTPSKVSYVTFSISLSVEETGQQKLLEERVPFRGPWLGRLSNVRIGGNAAGVDSMDVGSNAMDVDDE